MKGVIDDILVRALPDGERWELFEDFEWDGIVVPTGFITDFASIPAFARGWISPTGKIKPAALVHDWLYHEQGVLPDRILTRKDCDDEFLEIMKLVGVGFIKRHAAYRAVRMFGWIGWNKRKKELINGKA